MYCRFESALKRWERQFEVDSVVVGGGLDSIVFED